jgi:hypothetical protein
MKNILRISFLVLFVFSYVSLNSDLAPSKSPKAFSVFASILSTKICYSCTIVANLLNNEVISKSVFSIVSIELTLVWFIVSCISTANTPPFSDSIDSLVDT